MQFHLIALLLLASSCVIASSTEKLLLKDLLTNYCTIARPVKSVDTAVAVNVVNTVLLNFDYCDKRKVMTANTYLHLQWTDENLVWNPEDYGGVKRLYIPANRVWTPELFAWQNTVPITSEGSTRPVRVIYDNTGSAFLIDPREFKARCVDMDEATRNCSMRIGSWVYSENEIKLATRSDKVKLTSLFANHNWTVESATQMPRLNHFEGTPDAYPDVLVSFILRKNTGNHLF